MGMTSITRREILTLWAGLAVAGFSRARACDPAGSERISDALLRIARRLYPHPALEDAVYLDVLKPLRAEAAADPKIAAAFEKGCAELDAFAGGDWLHADTGSQIAALRSIEDSAFFEKLRNAVRVELYDHPEVWRLLGFEGSSVEHGGYIDRGFDDIDWLPGTEYVEAS